MSARRQKKTAVAVSLALALLLMFLLWRRWPSAPPTPPAPIPVAKPVPTVKAEIPVPSVKPAPTAVPGAPIPPKLPGVAHPPPPMPGPAAQPLGPAELHRELIPKDIVIVRFYYEQEVAAPGTTFGFDIIGSGFNADFEKMIQVDLGTPDAQVQSLRLATANQIHGSIAVSRSAKTAFVSPKVLIKGLPVFKAPEPFGVVRFGEILTVKVLELAPDGRSETFRVVTNIDDNMFRQFWIEPDRPGLEVSDLRPVYPFAVEGTVGVGAASTGDYTLVVSIFSKEKFRWRNVHIVPPNLGKTGLAMDVECQDPFRRPGDKVRFYLLGTGFRLEDAGLPAAAVEGFNMGPAAFAYISPTHMSFEFAVPRDAPPGIYGVAVQGAKFEPLVHQKEAFTVVPPLWVGGVDAAPAAKVGQKSSLRIWGRDFTPDFARGMRIEADDPGIRISPVSFVDASTLAADMDVGPAVSAGDYWLHLSAGGRAIPPQSGGILKIAAP